MATMVDRQAIPPRRGVPVSRAGMGGLCKWPVLHPGQVVARDCGADCPPGRSYCARHLAQARLVAPFAEAYADSLRKPGATGEGEE